MFDAAMDALRRIQVLTVDGVGLIALIDADRNSTSAEEADMKRVSVEITIKSVNLDDATDTFEGGAKYGNMSFESFQAIEDAVLDGVRNLRANPDPAAT